MRLKIFRDGVNPRVFVSNVALNRLAQVCQVAATVAPHPRAPRHDKVDFELAPEEPRPIPGGEGLVLEEEVQAAVGGGAEAGSHCQRQGARPDLCGECCAAGGCAQAGLPEIEARELRAHSGSDVGAAEERRRIGQDVEGQAAFCTSK